ncbi:DNA methyltransferase [Miltoncostaea oceani]|uniref:DNA methyltransferase n=1 Tax=Miltoncostaea oceani TaxID=2843216 RepID=UPI001C3CE917|nr:site-specific DNA-methyltransferase [Miltoncostaea oceani]
MRLEALPGYHRALTFGGDARPGSALLFGDNLRSLEALERQAAAQGVPAPLSACYTDPPYNTGEQWELPSGVVAYDDSWTDDAEFYAFLRPRLAAVHRLLSPSASVYVHIDVRISPYIRVMLDEIFGGGCFRNQITRIKCNPKNFSRRAYGSVTDVICFYSRTPAAPGPDPMYWGDARAAWSPGELDRLYPKTDADGRRYATTPLHAKGRTLNGPTGEAWRGLMPPEGKHWRRPPADLEELDQAGRIEWSSTGNPREIIYADESAGRRLQDLWTFKDPGVKRSRYPTQKPLEMLEMLVRQSSPEGGLVLDPFAGSGSTLVAAERNGRAWIGCDQGHPSLAASLGALASDERAAFSLWLPDTEMLAGPAPFDVRVEDGMLILPAGADESLTLVAGVDLSTSRADALHRHGGHWHLTADQSAPARVLLVREDGVRTIASVTPRTSS